MYENLRHLVQIVQKLLAIKQLVFHCNAWFFAQYGATPYCYRLHISKTSADIDPKFCTTSSCNKNIQIKKI